MHHEYYRGSALVAETRVRRDVKSVVSSGDPVQWEATSIDLRHQVKGSSPAIWCSRVLTRAGVAIQVSSALMPVLLHIEALVYRGDLEYEAAQLEGRSDRVSLQWRDGVVEILRTYGIDTEPILSALSDLEDYFRLESAIMEGREPLTEDLIARSCYLRCSGGTLLLRIAFALAQIDYEERLFTLIRHMSAHDEVSTDLPSYEEDIADGTFNVLRLASWIYGPPDAVSKLGERAQGILSDLTEEIFRADRRTLALFAAIIPPILPVKPSAPMVVHRMLPRPLLAWLVTTRIRFHEACNPLVFPEPVADAPPVGNLAGPVVSPT